MYSADFNQDGHADLLTLSAERTSVSILLGTGQGTFSVASTSSLENPAQDVAVVQLDTDGLPDVVALHGARDALTLFKGAGDGRLVSYGQLAVGRWPSAAASADLDGDGQPELLVVESADNTVSVYTPPVQPLRQPVQPISCMLNPEPGGPAPRPRVAPVARLWTGKSLEGVAGDFDADGQMDLALGLEEGGTRLVLHSWGGPWAMRDLEASRRERPISLAAGDFDGDGRTDLAGVFQRMEDSKGMDYFRKRILWNEEAAPFMHSMYWGDWDYPSRLLAGDFNADGLLDLAISTENYFGGDADRLTNLGQRHFRSDCLPELNPSMDEPDGVSDGHLAAADFNGDGTLDLFYRTDQGLSLIPTAKDGTGLRGIGDSNNGIPRTGFFTAVDADGDGQMDVVSRSWWAPEFPPFSQISILMDSWSDNRNLPRGSRKKYLSASL